jgi:hypothetical protein
VLGGGKRAVNGGGARAEYGRAHHASPFPYVGRFAQLDSTMAVQMRIFVGNVKARELGGVDWGVYAPGDRASCTWLWPVCDRGRDWGLDAAQMQCLGICHTLHNLF